MSHLGSFGAAVKEMDPAAERDYFHFFGERFDVVGIVPPMLHLQLGATLSGKIGEAEGLGAMWETMRTSLTKPGADGEPEDDEQFVRFYKLAVARKADLNSLMDLAMTLFEGQAGRPTEGLPASAAGQSTTSPSSSTSSSVHPAFAHLTPVNELVGGSAV